MRQVLQHLSNAEIMNFLQRANYKHLYVTEGHPAIRIGPFNPDKVTDGGVRFDWAKGSGRGVELDKPPFCLDTTEVFRACERPNEIIITDQVRSRFSYSSKPGPAIHPGTRRWNYLYPALYFPDLEVKNKYTSDTFSLDAYLRSNEPRVQTHDMG